MLSFPLFPREAKALEISQLLLCLVTPQPVRLFERGNDTYINPEQLFGPVGTALRKWPDPDTIDWQTCPWTSQCKMALLNDSLCVERRSRSTHNESLNTEKRYLDS
ncbi:hypothetical protein Ddc_13882 [Ditylenchus destructor]|nr:hypothetical protein Ddc_13882 [Ditylenchus destructor]